MVQVTHTLETTLIPGFFTQENYNRISCILTNTIAKEYRQKVVFTPASIAWTCDQVYNERQSTVPEMNQRVILRLLQQFRNESDETERANWFLENRWEAYNHDPILGIQPYETPKLNDRARGFRFHFTF